MPAKIPHPADVHLHTKKGHPAHGSFSGRDIFLSAIFESVCERIRTFGALPHTTLAGWHHRPLGHANGKWMGQDSNLRCFFVTDLQSAALATRHTHPWGDQGESVSAPLRSAQSRCPPDILRPHKQSHNLPDYHCPIATVAPAGCCGPVDHV